MRRRGSSLRLLHRVEPRPLVLLVIAVLLLAGVLQPADLPVVASAPTPSPVVADRLRPLPPSWPDALAAPAAVVAAEPADRRRRRPQAPHARARAGGARPTALEQRGQAALDSLDYDWRRLGYVVVFRPYDGRALGTANRHTRRIRVYVRRGQSELSLRASIAHELGHALDFEHGTPERREAYRRIRGLPASTPWFPCNRCDDLSSPAGDFAEVFAAWLVGAGDFRSRLAGPPDRRQLAELTPLLHVPAHPTAADPAPEPQPTPSPSAARDPDGPLPPIVDPPPTPRAG